MGEGIEASVVMPAVGMAMLNDLPDRAAGARSGICEGAAVGIAAAGSPPPIGLPPELGMLSPSASAARGLGSAARGMMPLGASLEPVRFFGELAGDSSELEPWD